jgi:DNA-binding transcriptional ArsR family regulator
MTKKRKQTHVLRDLEQMEAMVSPLRQQIMRTVGALDAPSIKEVAAQLERSPESLYYHFRALEEVGLLISAGTREVKGRSEALFATVARRIATDAGAHTSEYLDAFRRGASALLRLADRQLAGALERQEEDGCPRPPSLRIQQLNARLTPKAAAELARKLDDVMSFMYAADEEGGQMVSVTLVSSPIGKRAR